MKKILSTFLLLIAGAAFGATTTPVQLLSPTGSTTGQVIKSNGPSSAPTWGAPSITTVTGTLPIANGGTGATSAATALSNLGAGATAGTLAQFSATTSAELAGVISNETGSGALVFGTSPAISGGTLSGTFAGEHTYSGAISFTSTITPSQTSGIVGTTTNNSANAGSVGEYLTNSTTGTNLVTNTDTNATSVSLTAGDWDVDGIIAYNPAVGTTLTIPQVGIGTTSATMPITLGVRTVWSFTHLAGNNPVIIPSPTVRMSLSGTTTVYLVGRSTVGGSTVTIDGFIRARRVR